MTRRISKFGPQPWDFRPMSRLEFDGRLVRGEVIAKASERSPEARFWILRADGHSEGDETRGVTLRPGEAFETITAQVDDDGKPLRCLKALKKDPNRIIIAWTPEGRAWNRRRIDWEILNIRATFHRMSKGQIQLSEPKENALAERLRVLTLKRRGFSTRRRRGSRPRSIRSATRGGA
jgi:hypothetical protein